MNLGSFKSIDVYHYSVCTGTLAHCQLCCLKLSAQQHSMNEREKNFWLKIYYETFHYCNTFICVLRGFKRVDHDFKFVFYLLLTVLSEYSTFVYSWCIPSMSTCENNVTLSACVLTLPLLCAHSASLYIYIFSPFFWIFIFYLTEFKWSRSRKVHTLLSFSCLSPIYTTMFGTLNFYHLLLSFMHTYSFHDFSRYIFTFFPQRMYFFLLFEGHF